MTPNPISASTNVSADGWRARLPVSNTQPAIYTYDPSGNTVEERINFSSSPFAGYVCVFDAYGNQLAWMAPSGDVKQSDGVGFGGE